MIEKKTTEQIIDENYNSVTCMLLKENKNKVWISEDSYKSKLNEIKHFIVGVQMSEDEWNVFTETIIKNKELESMCGHECSHNAERKEK